LKPYAFSNAGNATSLVKNSCEPTILNVPPPLMYLARSAIVLILLSVANFLGSATAHVLLAGAGWSQAMPTEASSDLAVS